MRLDTHFVKIVHEFDNPFSILKTRNVDIVKQQNIEQEKGKDKDSSRGSETRVLNMHSIIFLGLVFRVAHSLSSHVIDLFPNGTKHLENAFSKVYAHMNETYAALAQSIG